MKVNLFFFIFFCCLTSNHATPKLTRCSVPLALPYDESLKACWADIQKHWLVESEQHLETKELEKHVLSYYENNEQRFIEFATPSLFAKIHQSHSKVVGNFRPRFLLIVLDHQKIAQENSVQKSIWKEHAKSLSIDLIEPFWDLDDLVGLEWADLKGHSSNKIRSLCEKYRVQEIIIVQLNNDFDTLCYTKLSVHNSKKSIVSNLHAFDLIDSIKSSIVTDYPLSPEENDYLLRFKRPQFNFQAIMDELSTKYAEITTITPIAITATDISVSVRSHFQERHWSAIELFYDKQLSVSKTY